METTRQILIGVAIAAIAFFIGRCATTEPGGLTGEEKFLAKYGLLDDNKTMVQTVTRFQKDVANQKLFLAARYKGSANTFLDSVYQISPSEEKSLRDRLSVFSGMDLQYKNRLETVLQKKETNQIQTFSAIGGVKVCPCPPEDEAANANIGDYCIWKEKAFMPIIVDTTLWDVQQILIEEVFPANNTTGNLIANSTNPDTKITRSPGSTYVLYELFNELGTIPVGTYVLFTVRWRDGNGDIITTSLMLQVGASTSSN